MARYNVGDRLIWVGRMNSEFYTVGKVYEVLNAPQVDDDGHFYMLTDNGRCRHTWDADGIDENFKLAASSPIRTVTRREIVPGVYGNVEIEEVGKTYVAIGEGSLYYANDLREAAKLFNELADVLEENAA